MQWDIGCERVQRLLSSYIDRELTYEEERQVALHVDGCLRCARDLEHLRSLKGLLSSLPSEDLPQGFWLEVKQMLEAEAAGAQFLPATSGFDPASDFSPSLPGPVHGFLHGWRSLFPRGPETSTRPTQNHRLRGTRLGAIIAAAAVPAVLFAVMPLLLHPIALRREPVGVAPFIRTHVLSSYGQPLADDAWINYVALGSGDDHWWPDITSPETDKSPIASSRYGLDTVHTTLEISAEPWGPLP